MGTELIAIIGMGCRFAGARDTRAYWRILSEGIDAVTEIPSERFCVEAVYDPVPGTLGKTVSRWGGFLDDIDQFDPYFFGISPREAVQMDPQQRLMLEAAWEAVEDAGLPSDRLAGSRTAAFIGVSSNEYVHMRSGDFRDLTIYFGSGDARATAGRLSQVFGLNGPAVAVDTACSSSLVAVHLACEAIRNQECELAFAGGTNLVLSPEFGIALSQAGMLSPEGRCKTFDGSADGFVRSEGIGVVLLKPLSKARADRDPVYAVIRGSAINNDGDTSSFMTPSVEGQVAALERAYAGAGVSPTEVQYVEAHGTGTRVGDRAEVAALNAVLGAGRSTDHPCLIGSAKTNIGHAEAAAGVAGLIKAALCLKHGFIPPSLHCKEPNPAIPWSEIPFRVAREGIAWPRTSRPRLAGVSSFGISGTNAHIVLEEAPPEEPVPDVPRSAPDVARLLPLSARTREDLSALARSYWKRLSDDGQSAPALRDVCYTAAVRRSHHPHRLAVTAHTMRELLEGLDAYSGGRTRPGVVSGSVSNGGDEEPVFLFSGVGGQWASMGVALHREEPVFAATIERCDQAIRRHAGWSLLEELEAAGSACRLDRTDIMQPAIFSLEVALAALWKSWGVEPAAVAGHSLGEYAAAHVAGVLTLEDAIGLVCLRGELMQRTAGQGAMLAVELNPEQALEAIATYGGSVSLATWNGPSSTVLAGDPKALAAIENELKGSNLFCRFLNVDVACHSSQMEPLVAEFTAGLSGLTPHPESIPIYSTVTGGALSGDKFDAAYWVRNLCDRALFAPVAETLLEKGHRTFLELGPHPMLLYPLRQTASKAGPDITALPSMRRGQAGRAVALGSLGALYVRGFPVDWPKQHPAGGRVISLPSYPWQRQRYWHEASSSQNTGLGNFFEPGGSRRRHPFLATHWESADHPGTHYWECEIDTVQFPYLNDHQFHGVPLLPLAAYIEMALAASFEIFGPGPRIFRNVELKKPVFLPKQAARRLQVMLSPGEPGASQFRIYLLETDGGRAAVPWALCAQGTIQHANLEFDEWTPPNISRTNLDAEYDERLDGKTVYARALRINLHYGDRFQSLQECWIYHDRDESLCSIQFPPAIRMEATLYCVHPVLLDGLFQSPLSLVLRDEQDDKLPILPYGITELQFREFPQPGTHYWSRVVKMQQSGRDSKTGLEMFDEKGRLILKEIGHLVRTLEEEKDTREQTESDEWLYHTVWESADRQTPAGTADGRWLILGDQSGLGQRLHTLVEQAGGSSTLVNSGAVDRIVADFLAEDSRAPVRGIVYLRPLDTPPNPALQLQSLELTEEQVCGGVLRLVQTLANHPGTRAQALWLVTRGAQPVPNDREPVNLAQSRLLGFARVIPIEHPGIRTTRIDLDPAAPDTEAEALFAELLAGGAEPEVALRGERRYVMRLVRYNPAPSFTPKARKITIHPSRDRSFELQTQAAGVLENLKLREVSRRPPAEGEVEIQVSVAGLNFLDVLKALDLAPGPAPGPVRFGMECAGRITAVGKGVEGFEVGDEVIAWNASTGCLRAFLTTSARVVSPKPPNLTSAEAATTSVVYQTAYYALHHLGRLRRGESVLIHSAAGGVGLAAIEVARRAGAEIFATAGSPEKRAYLRSLGIRYVMNSRTLDFAEEVLNYTNGRGVDVVLNSLAGDAIPKSLSVLATGGRFLEIGKRDIYADTQLGLLPFQKNLSFFAIDLFRLSLERPEIFEALAREVNELVTSGAFKPLPYKMFPVTEVADAFHYMAQGAHTGKILIDMGVEEVEVEAPDPLAAVTGNGGATCLITGGFGALGLEVAQWLVEKGARHLALMGRRGLPVDARPAVEKLRAAGARVEVLKGDVSRPEDLAAALDHIREKMPPLRGVIHCAGIVKDGVIQQMDWARFASVFPPKVSGAWNLHNQLREASLDFFVLFSSFASVLGSAGQSNYAAANAFLDSLAHFRRSADLPALSVNWGPWAEAGMAAAREDRGARLTGKGIDSIPPAEGVRLLGRLLSSDATQVVVCPIDWRRWAEADPAILTQPVLRHFFLGPDTESTAGLNQGSLLDSILDAEDAEQGREALAGYLREQVARVLRIPDNRFDPQVPLNRLGLDSLMAVELKNRVELDLSLTLPVGKLLQGPSIITLAAWLYEEIEQAAEAIGLLSDDEAAKLLLADDGEKETA